MSKTEVWRVLRKRLVLNHILNMINARKMQHIKTYKSCSRNVQCCCSIIIFSKRMYAFSKQIRNQLKKCEHK
jgi:hypothetical protein